MSHTGNIFEISLLECVSDMVVSIMIANDMFI